jgi:hypothetical protein
MSIFAGGIVAFVAMNLSLFIVFARMGSLPARESPDQSGHVLKHALIEKVFATFFSVLVVVGFMVGIYAALREGSWLLGLYVSILFPPFGWISALYLRKQRNVIELTEVGMTWRRGTLSTAIRWNDVSGFSEAPSSTAWIIRAKDGRTLRVDKLLIGVPTTFVEYLRKYLPPSLFDTSFAYVRPKAALRARINRHSGSG